MAGNKLSVGAPNPKRRLRPAAVPKRGRPCRGEVRPVPHESALQREQRQTLALMIDEAPATCDRGTKCNAQG